jgi:amino acid transporter
MVGEEHLSKVRALAVFSSDALSSVAYATEEILLVLVLAGSAFLSWSLPIAITIVCLLFLVVFSYRETIYEYPSGGGAYVVAKDNLGPKAGLVAGSALLIDYILTVAVSIASGTAALASAFPSLSDHRIMLSLVAIGVVMLANLRGINESAKIFMFPTYAFIFSVLCMIVMGFYKLQNGTYSVEPPPVLPAQNEFTLFLLLRAFSSGCTAMTGIEAVSNGVPVFGPPKSKNAAITLVVMATILAAMFVGITYLADVHGVVPSPNETVISQVARAIFGASPAYYFLQFMTMGILVLAANTSFADFPRLASILAKDRYLPRQFASMGDRLVFSNGIVILGALSGLLIVLFKANTHALIPLYAVGVFLSFTLSQGGMVRFRLKNRKPGWLPHLVINFIGMVATAIVMMIFVVTKFTHGAWLITLLIPIFIYLFQKIYDHYLSVGKQLSLIGVDPVEFKECPKHTVLLPISGIHKGVLEALRYARSIAEDVRAVYVEIDSTQTERMTEEWRKWGQGVPLVVLKSPYRSIMAPFLKYVDEVEDLHQDDIVTVIIPEFVTARWWQNLLHNQTALLIRAALTFKRRKVVTSVRYHLG